LKTEQVQADAREARRGARPAIRLLARLSRVAETAFHETGISLPQYRLLVLLDSGGRRAGEVAADLGVTRPTLTSLVDGLERNGLLRRVPVASDRRGVRLEATRAGREALERAERRLSERLGPLVEPAQAEVASALVSSVCSALDREQIIPR
jgi:DNA-binding MarR family transcriptional regulator